MDPFVGYLPTGDPEPCVVPPSMADLHPFVVHFPVAFLSLGAVGALLEFLRHREPRWAFVDLLCVLGGVAALLAAATGNSALGRLTLPADLQAAADLHARSGSLAAWLAGAALMGRVAARMIAGRSGAVAATGGSGIGSAAAKEVRRRRPPASPARRGTVMLLATLVSLAAAGATLVAAHRGGRLVHRFGVTAGSAGKEPMPEAPDRQLANSPPRDGDGTGDGRARVSAASGLRRP
jgi:hypothetical protein